MVSLETGWISSDLQVRPVSHETSYTFLQTPHSFSSVRHKSQAELLYLGKSLQNGDEVEFEIDELDKIEKRPLRATLVRRSVRPLTMRLQSSDAPELKAHHHPKARKRRPTWRDKKEDQPDPDSEGVVNPGSDD